MRSIDFQQLRVNLALIELDLVGTFLRVARQSSNAQARQRNRVYARQAYLMARHYATALPPKMNRGIGDRLVEAKNELEDAGELV